MLRIESSGVASVEMSEAAEVRGGGGLDPVVAMVGLLATAAGLGFKWGYEHLGPFLNRYL